MRHPRHGPLDFGFSMPLPILPSLSSNPGTRKLSSLMERVFAATGCHLRPERGAADVDSQEKGSINARTVGLEWAGEFRVRSKAVNAHEAMAAAMDLKEMPG